MSEISVVQAWNAIAFEKDAQSSNKSTATIYYIVSGATDDIAAITAVETTAPATYEGITRKSINVEERLTETEWKVSVKYANQVSSNSNNEDREPQFSFDISNGTKKIVHSFAQKKKYPSNSPDSCGINDGEGVDIICPVCTIAETHFFNNSKISTSWKKNVAKMVGCINKSSFRGYDAGELLFTGCSGTRVGDGASDEWQITFRFAVQPNQSVSIGTLGIISKRGWDVLWVRYQEKIETSGSKKIVIKVPQNAYVEQVYEEANFNSLGI